MQILTTTPIKTGILECVTKQSSVSFLFENGMHQLSLVAFC